MKTTAIQCIAAAVAVAASGGVFADEGNYPLSITGPDISVKTRAQVIAEMYEVVAPEEVPAKTRAQVIAELREAQRLGLVPVGEADVPRSTAEQEAQIALAGRLAAQPTVARK